MARRHEFKSGDWETIATRLDEIICAHTGEDPFEETLKLLVAKLAHEHRGDAPEDFLAGVGDSDSVTIANGLLAEASERWRGVLEPGSTCHLTGPELARCAELLRSSSLVESDLVGLDTMFEFIVNKAAKGQKGQYFTPRHVVDAAVRMVAPTAGELVVDPACGSGAFLRQVLRLAHGAQVFGFDQDPRAVRVARVMMVASGQPAGRIARVNSLRKPEQQLFDHEGPAIEELMQVQVPRFAGFDLVVTNPPFAGDVGAEFCESYELGVKRRVERDVLFLERCVGLLRPGGRLAIVLPHNKVGGAQWSYAREWLLKRTRVVGVVGLGRNTFQPHTSQKASVVVAIKRARSVERVPRDEEIIFFVSGRDGKDSRGRPLFREDEPDILDHDLDESVVPIRNALSRAAAEF